MPLRSFSTYSQETHFDRSSVVHDGLRLGTLKKVGDYELLTEIGRGGMGVVYRARQTFLNQSVAIKVLTDRYTDDPLIVSRFRREMQMIGRLDHPNIVRALNAGESQGILYLVMEYVEGINLAKLVHFQREQQKPSSSDPGTPSLLGIGTAVEIIRQALLGLNHAYSQGLVHRDIKPANLMITRSGTVKILDLGLGKFWADNHLTSEEVHEEAKLTQIGTTVGTIDYIAPEQCENATNVDIRADIYSLGCTLFFLLAGEAPLDGPEYSSVRKKLLAHINGNIPSISRFRSDCPDELQRILSKMIDPNIEDRFQTPGEVLEVITPFAQFSDLFSLVTDIPEQSQSEIPSTPDLQSADKDTKHGSNRPYSSQTGSSATLYSQSARYRVNQMNPHLKRILGSSALFLLLVGIIIFFFARSEPEITKPRPQSRGHSSKNSPNNTTFLAIESEEPGKPSHPLHSSTPVTTKTDSADGVIQTETTSTKEGNQEETVPHAGIVNKEISSQYERILRDLIQLPGLSGQWWSSEIPWYLPYVRENLARSIQSGQQIFTHSDTGIAKGVLPYLDPNIVRVHEFIWNLILPSLKNMATYRGDLVGVLKKTLDSRMEKEQLLPIFIDALAQFEKSSDSSSATDLHTIALLQHQIAWLKNDEKIALQARETYQQAIRQYTEEEKTDHTGHITATLLKSVARSDLARLEYWSESDYTKFERLARLILQTPELSNLFRIEFLTVLGTNSISSGQNDNRLFEEARVLLEQSDIDSLVHPLSGYIQERLAWSLTDQCQFQEAAQKFTEALRIRENNRDQSHNPFAAINVFHNLHGIALVKRYLGDTDGAAQGFTEVLKLVKAELEQSDFDEPAQLRYFQDLRERLYNSQERFGDCILYGGAAGFGTSSSTVSPSDMTNAVRLYEQALQANENKSTRLVLSCKLAIVQALLGQLTEAKHVLAELDQTGITALGTERRRAALLRQIADAVILLKESETTYHEAGIAQGREALRRFLMPFSGDSAGERQFRRETLESQLFCIELLLSSQLESGHFLSARNDLSFLDPLLIPFANFKTTRPYLRRYYDLAIRCFNDNDLQESASGISEQSLIANQLRYIRQSRLWKEEENKDSGTLFFYFSPKRGVVIFMPKDNRPFQRFFLDYSRNQIKEAVNSGPKLPLPEPLMELFKTEQPGISFSDISCWFRKSDAFSEEDWPFDVIP